MARPEAKLTHSGRRFGSYTCGVLATVLVIEDDALIASSLQRALTANGYQAHTCALVAEACRLIDDDPPDLILLDLGLPDGDGSEVTAHVVRAHPTIPVMVLTARGEEIDLVLGLESGAVDYVVKPFRLAELPARIASHLRLREAMAAGRPRASDRVVVVSDVHLDRASRSVAVAGQAVALRPKGFDLLERLARDAGTVVTREQLIAEVWDEHWWGSTKTLDGHINSIRRKLGELAGGPSRITTIRGVGYRLEHPTSRSTLPARTAPSP